MDINTMKGLLLKASDPNHHREQESRMQQETEREIKRRVRQELEKKENPDIMDFITEMLYAVNQVKESSQKALATLDKAIEQYESNSTPENGQGRRA